MPSPATCVVLDLGNGKSMGHDVIKDHLLPKESLEMRDDVAVWSMENKYFAAEVHVVVVKSESWASGRHEAIQKSAEAIVLYAPKDHQLDLKTIQEAHEPCSSLDTKILVANIPQNSDISSWCLDEGIEIINMECPEDDQDEDEYFYVPPEERLSKALQLCQWSSMVQKSKTDGAKYLEGKTTEETAESESKLSKKADAKSSEEHTDNVEEDTTFEELFAQFASFRDRSKNFTSDDERREFAEKVVLSFWNALGGDPQEVEGIDSD